MRITCFSLLFLFLLTACQPAPTLQVTATAILPSSTAAVASSTPTPSEESAPSPTRPAQNREDILIYEVKEGDRLSDLALAFGLRPETILWANYDLLFDNSDALLPHMDLQILPVDGVYHQVGGGDTLTGIANFFGVDQQAILDWPRNGLEGQNPTLFAGQWLMVPEGVRLSRFRDMPNVPRDAANLDAAEFGSGACESDFAGGPIGDGDYGWPVSSHELRAEAFADWHPGIDIPVTAGEWVRAADDGVVTFAGWSNLGYGYLLVLDHGNGDYSLYGGLGEVIAACGHVVEEGEIIAEAGNTGHPAGSLLHFEIRRGAEFLDPLALLGE